MLPLNIKTLIDESHRQKTYLLFSSDAKNLDKTQVLIQSKTIYSNQEDVYQLTKLQVVLAKLLKKYSHASICLLSIDKIDDKKKITVCGQGQFICQIKTTDQSYSIPILKKGISGYLQDNDKIVIDFDTAKSEPEPKSISLAKSISHKQTLPIKDIVNSFKKTLLPLIPKIKKTENTSASFPQLQLQRKQKILISKKRFFALVLSGIFLLSLGFAIGTGAYKKNQFEIKKQEEQLYENIQYRLKQAEILKDLNPARAKTLLSEAQYLLITYQKQNKLPQSLSDLSTKIDQAYESVSQIFRLPPQIFYDLSLLSSPLQINSLALSQNNLSLLDNKNQLLLNLDIEKKKGQLVAGKELVPSDSQLASIEDWDFIFSSGKLKIIDQPSRKLISTVKFNTIQPDQLIGYGTNLYVLDKKTGQVYRFRSTDKTLKTAEKFFKDSLDLSVINSMSLDGSLWFLDQSGGVHKYTSGIKDAYYPDFGLDVSLANPNKLYTDEYCANLYILDKTNSRIVAISKDGIYQGQYTTPEIKNISDFVVSETLGKILLAKDDKILSIDLK